MPSDQGPLDSSTKVLEIESLGVKVHNVKRFWVVNPTSISWSFAWERVQSRSSAPIPSVFSCSTMTGTVAAGKRYEMVFEYTPFEDKLQVSPPKTLVADETLPSIWA